MEGNQAWEELESLVEGEPRELPPLGRKSFLLHESIYKSKRIGWLLEILRDLGFEQEDTESSKSSLGHWTVFWSNTITTIPEWPKKFRRGQRMNHFPSIGCLTTKANLSSLAKFARATHGPQHFEFLPEAHHLPIAPEELEELLRQNPVMIQKPASGSKGEGISLVTTAAEVRNHIGTVLQQYVEPPDVITGRKYHLRIFVAVMSLDPMRVFIHREGYARLTTKPFVPTSSGNLSNDVHVTNHVHDYEVDPSDTCYYSLKGYRDILKSRNQDDVGLFRAIDRAIGNTIFAAIPRMIAKEQRIRRGDNWKSTCFEILGADILIDAEMKPWLLEFNLSPSLETSTDGVLLTVKKEVFRDLFLLLEAEDSSTPPEGTFAGFHLLHPGLASR